MATRVSARLTRAGGRRFGLTVGAAFAAFGALLWWREHYYGAGVAALGGVLLIGAGLVFPGRLGLVYRAWMGLAAGMAKITTPVGLAIVYFGAFTPVGLLMRLVGHQPLARAPHAASRWVRRGPEVGHRSDMKRQF